MDDRNNKKLIESLIQQHERQYKAALNTIISVQNDFRDYRKLTESKIISFDTLQQLNIPSLFDDVNTKLKALAQRDTIQDAFITSIQTADADFSVNLASIRDDVNTVKSINSTQDSSLNTINSRLTTMQNRLDSDYQAISQLSNTSVRNDGIVYNLTNDMTAAKTNITNLTNSITSMTATPVWNGLTLTSPWVNFNNQWGPPAYIKDQFGVVWLRGLVSGGNQGQVITTLAPGYRPATSIMIPSTMDAQSSWANCTLELDTNGTIYIGAYSPGVTRNSGGWVSITCCFKATQ